MVIIDTNVFITESYAEFTFGKKLNVSEDVYRMNRAGLYLYLNNDVPYHQDGTRLSGEDRDALDLSHRNVLTTRGIDTVEIAGDWETRFQLAISKIDSLLANSPGEPRV